ncbi:uncharacterized protein LOC130825044 [Amaranthus tricolor]|uniref:uncharacterized protein LOC130825044 n=1 Tax=Amaranthus tricolor TaxID=29722 RepID=UPI0025883BDC|nr:uncharacterized protein LOC130825044 [Amaranthus tricolor]
MAHTKLSTLFRRILVLFLFLFLSSCLSISKAANEIDTQSASSTTINSMIKTMNRLNFFNKNGPLKKTRKLLEADLVQLDYDEAEPNPKHDPKRGRGGGRNP